MTHKIILSEDSACDLGPELKERCQVHFIPLHIILDRKDHKDSGYQRGGIRGLLPTLGGGGL